MNYFLRSIFVALLLLSGSIVLAQTEGASLDERGYGLYIPTTYDEDAEDELPLLLVLHGFGDTWQNFGPASGFAHLAEREHFIVAFPQGYLRQWNAGDRGDHQEDDVQILRELIEVISEDFRIDSERIYLAGFSNGSTMTYYTACNALDLFAGIAAVGGTMWNMTFEDCPEEATPAVILIHGTGDSVVPFTGGNGRVSVPDTMLLWAEHNGCNMEDVPEYDNARFRNGYAIYFYEDCPDGNIVMLNALQYVEHIWMGAEYYLRGLFPEELQFDNAQLIWAFFNSSYQMKLEANNPEMTPEADEPSDE